MQEDEDEVSEDEVKEFKQILLERKRDRENYFNGTILVRKWMKSNYQDKKNVIFRQNFQELERKNVVSSF